MNLTVERLQALNHQREALKHLGLAHRPFTRISARHAVDIRHADQPASDPPLPGHVARGNIMRRGTPRF